MPTDYAVIREQNIKEYGEGTRHLDILGRLYSDRTHFIFELLQNAEDAGATKVEFILCKDRLEVRHDGRPFEERDVRGICGVGIGTKVDDLTKIGKFGVGFKSVYVYTISPEIHCGDEHFRIEHYVRPYAVASREPGASFTTLFVFPLDRDDLDIQEAYEQIAGRLHHLGIRTLLFLRKIHEISWRVMGATEGTYLREDRPQGVARRIHVLGETKGEEGSDEETWLAFEQAISPAGHDASVVIEVAFQLGKDDETRGETIVRAYDTELVVFFPTDRETRLGFLIQGPYRTTHARDNIPNADEWNRQLLRATADLVAESLLWLRKMGLLDVVSLQALPIVSNHFRPDTMFRTIFDKVRAAFLERDLLPTASGGYTNARQARLARTVGLRSLLSEQQLRQLCGSEAPLYWLPDAITQDRTPELRAYLRGELGIDEITPETFANGLSATFLEQQPDEWMFEFYAFLLTQPALWRAKPPGILRNKPILRLEDGSHVAPRRADGSPHAYLPGAYDTGFPTVRRTIAEHPAGADLLRQLGLAEPDILAELREMVIPPYLANEAVTEDHHHRHMLRIIDAICTDSQAKRAEILALLRSVPFLLAENPITSERDYRKPDEVYLLTLDYAPYLIEHRTAWLLAEAKDIEDALTQKGWHDLGVASRPRIRRYDSILNEQRKRSLRRDQRYTRDIATVDCTLDGIEDVLESLPQVSAARAQELALAIWNTIIDQLNGNPYGDQLRGFEGTYTWQYFSSYSASFTAHWIELLKDNEWIPSRLNGRTHRPAKISIDELPEAFRRDERLARILGLGVALREAASKVAALAQETGVPLDLIDTMRRYPDQFAEFARQLKRDQERTTHVQTAASPASFAAGLAEVFEQPGRPPSPEGELAAEVVANPERRRERTVADLEAAQANEPLPLERFTRVPRKVWEAKHSEVRVFLQVEYGGRCQICTQTFAKQDGTPYFEGLYLVGHITSSWIGRPGNVICLCPTCCAKLQFGAVEANDIQSQILGIRLQREGGEGAAVLHLRLCGQDVQMRFTERHILDLQEMLKSSLHAAQQETDEANPM